MQHPTDKELDSRVAARSLIGTVLETHQDDLSIRKALGQMVLRVMEKLEAELVMGKAEPSTSAALAGRLLDAAQYLEGLTDRIHKQQISPGPEQVEKLLARLNSLTSDLQRLRSPKGIETRDPVGVVVEGGTVGKEALPHKPHQVPEALSRKRGRPRRGIVQGGGDGTGREGGR